MLRSCPSASSGNRQHLIRPVPASFDSDRRGPDLTLARGIANPAGMEAAVSSGGQANPIASTPLLPLHGDVVQ